MINCSFCGKEIRRDRYSIFLELERQDFPPDSQWHKSCERAHENVCSACRRKITVYFDLMISELKKK